MEDLKLRISSADLNDEEVLKNLIKDIMKLDDDNDIVELMNQIIERIKEELLQDTLSNLITEDIVSERISKVKNLFEENTDLAFSEIDKLFNNQELKPKKVMEEVLELVDEEIGVLEGELSEVIEKAEEEGLTVVEYLEKAISELEKEKSEQVKQYNELITAINSELEERNLFVTQEELENRISKLKLEQEEIYARSGGYPSEADAARYQEINEIILNIKEEIEYRNHYISKSVEELNEELEKLTKEQEQLWNASISSGSELSEKDQARFDEIKTLIKYIEIELKRKERTKYDSYSDEDIITKIEKLKKEQENLWTTSISSGEELNEKDQARFEELKKLITELENELKKREDNKFSKLTNKDIISKIEALKKEQEQLWNVSVSFGEELNEKDQARFEELKRLITELENELKKREEDPTKSFGSMSSEELEKLLEEYSKKQKNIQSDYDKVIENLNVQLKKAKRLEALKEYKNNKGNKKKIDKIEKAKQLALKALVAIGGFGVGLSLSSVPGVGVIRTIAATAKLTVSAINVWTKKFPEGKVAKLVSTTQEKFDEKFGDKISSFKEKHPKIVSAVKTARDKIKQVLSNKNVNLFINGLSAGYLVGNAIELFTGKTVFEHFNGMFDNDTTAVIEKPTEWDSGNTNPTIPEETGNVEIPEDIVPEVETIDTPPTEITLESGATYDLSGISEGFVSSTADQPVGLMTDVADDVTFDRIVNGRAHFIQSNGQGMAWYDLEEVKEYLSETAEVSSKVGKIK